MVYDFCILQKSPTNHGESSALSEERSDESKGLSPTGMPHHFYIARCADNSLYIGVTNDTAKRIARHNRGEGARWFKNHGMGTIVYTETYPNYLTAHRRELQVKKWSRQKKENLVKGLKP